MWSHYISKSHVLCSTLFLRDYLFGKVQICVWNLLRLKELIPFLDKKNPTELQTTMTGQNLFFIWILSLLSESPSFFSDSGQEACSILSTRNCSNISMRINEWCITALLCIFLNNEHWRQYLPDRGGREVNRVPGM